MTNYPEHDHQFIVSFYESGHLDRNFGPFSTREEAKLWARQFNTTYARPGERRRYHHYSIVPVCAALPLVE